MKGRFECKTKSLLVCAESNLCPLPRSRIAHGGKAFFWQRTPLLLEGNHSVWSKWSYFYQLLAKDRRAKTVWPKRHLILCTLIPNKPLYKSLKYREKSFTWADLPHSNFKHFHFSFRSNSKMVVHISMHYSLLATVIMDGWMDGWHLHCYIPNYVLMHQWEEATLETYCSLLNYGFKCFGKCSVHQRIQK